MNHIFIMHELFLVMDIGLVSIVEVETDKTTTPNEELVDVQWLTKEELIRDISNYELWSQHLIQTLK